jgi:Rrf2 family transcriptional regulator, iron-sulfur cluster assembly transcription factor
MSIIFSRQCEYGLQAVLYLALKPQGKMTSIRELTKRLDIPYHFVAKILQDLTRKGLLASMKGPAGGFTLAMPAKEITLFHIIEAIDGVGFMHDCLLGFPECTGKNPCALHESWAGIRDNIYNMLVTKSIDTMAGDMQKSAYKHAST